LRADGKGAGGDIAFDPPELGSWPESPGD